MQEGFAIDKIPPSDTSIGKKRWKIQCGNECAYVAWQRHRNRQQSIISRQGWQWRILVKKAMKNSSCLCWTRFWQRQNIRSREFTGGLAKGGDYSLLSNVIAINIANFEAVAIDDFHSVFHLWEDTHRDCLLTDALEIHFIDMKKFNSLPDKDIMNNSLHRWLKEEIENLM